MKNILIAAVLFVVLSVLVFILAGCASVIETAKSVQALKNCDYELVSIAPEVTLTYPLANSTVNMVFDVKIANPNPSKLNMTKLGFDLLVNDTKVFNGVTDYNLSIPANSSGVIKVYSKFGYNELQKSFLTLARAVADQKATYQINGTAYFQTILGEVNFPMTLKKGEIK